MDTKRKNINDHSKENFKALYRMFLFMYIEEMKTKVISIREEQDEWLQKHKSINLSGFVQEKLDELIEKEKKDE